MIRMWKFTKNCLLCLKDVNLEEKGDGEGSHSSGRKATRLSTSSNKNGAEIQPLTLFQLVQHPKFVGSVAHENIIQGHEGEGTCALCNKCAALSEDLAAVAGQIFALQAILGEMVAIIRGRVVDSDGKRRANKLSESQGIDDQGLGGLLKIRQSLLILSVDDESDNGSQVDNEVRVKIEDNGYDDDDDNFLHVFQSQPCEDFLNKFEDDEANSECLFFINPEITPKNNRVSKRKITNDNHTSKPIPRKRGRPKKTQIEKKQKSITNHDSRKFPCDSLSNPDNNNDQKSECDQLEMDDTKEKLRRDGKRSTLKSFKCDSCSRSYNSKALLNNHILNLHRHSCQLCKQRFRTKTAMAAHEKANHGKPKENKPKQIRKIVHRAISCLVCQRKCYGPSRLRIHMFMKHETKDKPFVCIKCDKRFTLEFNVERHLELHKVEDKKPVVCDVCDSRFENKARLELHEAIHRKNFHCEHCNYSYFTKANLERHIRTHTGEKPFQCDQCQERFIDKQLRQAHIDKIHSTRDQHHLCTICGKTFFNLSNLKIHLNRHEGKTTVACKTCAETFENYDVLNRHYIQRHGREPFACDECGVKVSTKRNLKIHKLIHSSDKPHACDICDTRFKRKETLKDHMRSHSAERPFVCHHCGKAFKLKVTLTKHVQLIHTADYVVPTPFLCSHCGKAFPRQGFLDDHVRQAHTGERPFVCQVCNKDFAIKTSLTQHMKSHGIISSREKGSRLPRSKRDEGIFSSPSVGLVQIPQPVNIASKYF